MAGRTKAVTAAVTTSGNGSKPAPIVPVRWVEYRCKACGRLQFKAMLMPGSRVQVRCWHSSCSRMNVFQYGERKAVEVEPA